MVKPFSLDIEWAKIIYDGYSRASCVLTATNKRAEISEGKLFVFLWRLFDFFRLKGYDFVGFVTGAQVKYSAEVKPYNGNDLQGYSDKENQPYFFDRNGQI